MVQKSGQPVEVKVVEIPSFVICRVFIHPQVLIAGFQPSTVSGNSMQPHETRLGPWESLWENPQETCGIGASFGEAELLAVSLVLSTSLGGLRGSIRLQYVSVFFIGKAT